LEWWGQASDDDRAWLDGQLRRHVPDYAAWLDARQRPAAAAGSVDLPDPEGGSMFWHEDSLDDPAGPPR
jgi:hypothetical protein